jgi:hypothetical protein
MVKQKKPSAPAWFLSGWVAAVYKSTSELSGYRKLR